MIKIRRTTASVIGALLVMGVCSVAAAQTTEHPQAPGTTSEPKQAQFDREKVTLKDQVQDAINTSTAQIDALKKRESTDKDAAQKVDKDMGKKLSDLRGDLKNDLDKIDKAAPNDWATVRTTVESDLKLMDAGIKTAANVTHVSPTTGAASKQPPSK
jgi:uncharacterized membrane protein YdfJ with MMPL/SSD domain